MARLSSLAAATAEILPFPAQVERRGGAPLRLLTFSTLYPNTAQPNHGIFVENRLRHLVESGAATSTVVAPVPWFPSRDARFGEWARCAAAPAEEMRHGLRVLHPRYAAPPRLGMYTGPWALLRAGRAALAQLIRRGRALRCHRCALSLPGRRRRGVACARGRAAGGDHRARFGHQPAAALRRFRAG